jgi:WD40 repeat protein
VKRRGTITSVTWTDDSLCRAVTTSEGLYLETLKEVINPVGSRRLNRKRCHFWSVAFTEELFELVTGDDDGNIVVWDTIAGFPMKIGKHEGPVWTVATGPDPRFVAAGGTDNTPSATLRNLARIWDLETDTFVPLHGHRAAVTGTAFSPDGKWVATSCYDGVVRLFDAKRGRLLHELTVAVEGRRHRPEAYAVCFAPKGDAVFAGYSDGRGRLFAL